MCISLISKHWFDDHRAPSPPSPPHPLLLTCAVRRFHSCHSLLILPLIFEIESMFSHFTSSSSFHSCPLAAHNPILILQLILTSILNLAVKILIQILTSILILLLTPIRFCLVESQKWDRTQCNAIYVPSRVPAATWCSEHRPSWQSFNVMAHRRACFTVRGSTMAVLLLWHYQHKAEHQRPDTTTKFFSVLKRISYLKTISYTANFETISYSASFLHSKFWRQFPTRQVWRQFHTCQV